MDTSRPSPPPHSPTPSGSPGSGFNRDRFWRLIAMYAVGVALGCVLVGVILQMKRQMLGTPTPPPAGTAPANPAPPAPAPPGAGTPTG